MPFRHKNVGAVYQRLDNEMFKEFIRNTMEVNSDDMLMKSLTTEYHLEHLKQTFDLFEKYQMKLNTIKYTFRVSLGKFLGYLVI